jgi:hypothetical protein
MLRPRAHVESFKHCCTGDNNYPWKTRQQCTHDVALPDGIQDDEYMQVRSALQSTWCIEIAPCLQQPAAMSSAAGAMVNQ